MPIEKVRKIPVQFDYTVRPGSETLNAQDGILLTTAGLNNVKKCWAPKGFQASDPVNAGGLVAATIFVKMEAVASLADLAAAILNVQQTPGVVGAGPPQPEQQKASGLLNPGGIVYSGAMVDGNRITAVVWVDPSEGWLGDLRDSAKTFVPGNTYPNAYPLRMRLRNFNTGAGWPITNNIEFHFDGSNLVTCTFNSPPTIPAGFSSGGGFTDEAYLDSWVTEEGELYLYRRYDPNTGILEGPYEFVDAVALGPL